MSTIEYLYYPGLGLSYCIQESSLLSWVLDLKGKSGLGTSPPPMMYKDSQLLRP